MDLKSVKFVRNPSPSEGGEGFAKGQTVRLVPESADRWIRRGAAILAEALAESKPNEKPKKTRRV